MEGHCEMSKGVGGHFPGVLSAEAGPLWYASGSSGLMTGMGWSAWFGCQTSLRGLYEGISAGGIYILKGSFSSADTNPSSSCTTTGAVGSSSTRFDTNADVWEALAAILEV